MAKMLYSATMSVDGYIAGGGGWNGPQFVLTHDAPPDPVPGVTFVGDIESAVQLSKAAAGERYVNILGAQTARACLDIGALDEVLVLIAPLLLGDGVRLFERPGGDNVTLERMSLSETPSATSLWFRVVR